MKTKISALSRAALVPLFFAALPALFAEEAPGKAEQTGQLRPAQEDPRGLRAKDLLGTNVYGLREEKLGDLHDLVVDARSGKVVYAIIASGGVLGVGDDRRVVPIEACTHSAGRISIEIDQARWKQAPLFDDKQLPDLNRADRAKEIHEFFREVTPDQSPAVADLRALDAPPQLVLVSKLRGRDVRGVDRSIGEIEDVIIQMKSRTVAVLFDPHDGFVGNDQHYLLPIGKLNGFHTDTLVTNLTREDFAGAAPSKDDSWASSTGYVNSLYIWPVWPFHISGGEPMVIFPGPINRDTDQHNREPAPLAAIRQAVQAEAPGEGNDIRVVTEKNKVILRGTVSSEVVKERVEERAEKAAAGWDIENQLRVTQAEP